MGWDALCQRPTGAAAWGVWPVLLGRYCVHRDLPCHMGLEEIKSLIRLPDIVACAKQDVATAAVSAREGTGLTQVLRWLQDTHRAGS